MAIDAIFRPLSTDLCDTKLPLPGHLQRHVTILAFFNFVSKDI